MVVYNICLIFGCVDHVLISCSVYDAEKGKLITLLFVLMQLDEMLETRGTKIDKVLNFAIDDAILEERITGRWIHPSSGRTYHTKFAPPKVPRVDDVRIDDINF